jgi:hypothetical protein
MEAICLDKSDDVDAQRSYCIFVAPFNLVQFIRVRFVAAALGATYANARPCDVRRHLQ